jgi:hypothetical protein
MNLWAKHVRKPLRGVDLIEFNSLELGFIKEATQSILARHPKVALGIVIGGKDKR